MNYPKVSIIILNWNGLKDTVECLESLKKISYPNYEIIIVDNASIGDDVNVLKKKYGSYIHIITNDRNYGFPEGCNFGARYALSKGTDYLLFLNNDTIVDPEFLTELGKVAEGNPSIGILGSKVYYYFNPDTLQQIGGKIWWWLGWIEVNGGVKDVGQWDDIAERDFVFMTSALIKREVVDRIGFMDPYFFFGIEDYDYCTRAKRAGFKLVTVPLSKVWHKGGASSSKLPQFHEIQKIIRKRQGFRQYKYHYILFRRYCPPVLFIIPLILHVTLLGGFLFFLSRGDFRSIKLGLAMRLPFLFKGTNTPRLPR
jgi:GT2 family glycosyltransferase